VKRVLHWLIPLALFASLMTAGYAVWYAGTRGVPRVAVNVPELSPVAREGRAVFGRSCAVCHGEDGAGGPGGPPLVHAMYRPAHHADVAFVLAVRRGVAAHHWNLGDMPPQRDVAERELEAIVRYVRELQRANGIE
jgi:mono/diheme cytochrome c family protein